MPQESAQAASADISEAHETESVLEELMASTPDPPMGGTTEPIEPTSDDIAAEEQAAEATPNEVEAEPVKPTEFEPVSNLDDVDLSTWGLDEAIAPRVQQLLDRSREIAATATSNEQALRNTVNDQVNAYRENYEKAEQELRAVVNALQENGPEAQDVMDTLTSKNQIIDDLNRHTASMAWSQFEDNYPNYRTLPTETKTAFAQLMQSNRYLEMGDENATLYQRVEEALKYAAYKTKADLGGARRADPTAMESTIRELRAEIESLKANATSAPAAKKSAGKTKKASSAQAQAVLGAQTLPPHVPTVDYDSVSYEELMDRNDHLLG